MAMNAMVANMHERGDLKDVRRGGRTERGRIYPTPSAPLSIAAGKPDPRLLPDYERFNFPN